MVIHSYGNIVSINLGLVPIFIVILGHYITIINVTLFILVLVITVADGIHNVTISIIGNGKCISEKMY